MKKMKNEKLKMKNEEGKAMQLMYDNELKTKDDGRQTTTAL